MNIEEKNAKFAKLPRAQQRVAIAKDILKMLGDGKLVAAHCYFKVKETVPDDDGFMRTALSVASEVDPDGSFQALIPKLPECKVCAKGAIFLATVRRRNRVTNENAQFVDFEASELSRLLGGVFSVQQLALIENAYENSRMDDSADCPDFAVETWDSDDRLRAIMRNIIRNEGTFKPTKKG